MSVDKRLGRLESEIKSRRPLTLEEEIVSVDLGNATLEQYVRVRAEQIESLIKVLLLWAPVTVELAARHRYARMHGSELLQRRPDHDPGGDNWTWLAEDFFGRDDMPVEEWRIIPKGDVDHVAIAAAANGRELQARCWTPRSGGWGFSDEVLDLAGRSIVKHQAWRRYLWDIDRYDREDLSELRVMRHLFGPKLDNTVSVLDLAGLVRKAICQDPPSRCQHGRPTLNNGQIRSLQVTRQDRSTSGSPG